MTDESASTPAIATKAPGNDRLDEALVVNGSINIRKTHPNLYRTVMTFALLQIALGINFLVFTPVFLIFGLPNALWGSIFLMIGVGKIVFLNVLRRLKLVRAAMALATGYMVFLAVGTGQAPLEGKASLQLPLLYVGLAVLQVPLLVEPFINPWTAKRDTR